MKNNKLKILHFENLYSFSILNFVEKFLAYLSPLLIIQIFDDRILYNQIELIYSFSIIFNIFFDFGLRGYFTYSLRKIKNKRQFSIEVLNYFNSLFLLISVLTLLLISLIFNNFEKSQLIIFSLIYFRFVYLYLTFFFKVYFRLISNPFYIFFITIPINLLVVIFIFYGLLFNNSNIDLITYFLPFIILLTFYILYLILSLKLKIIFYRTIKFLIKSMKFYWPIILTSIISLFIGNFIKIFSFYELSPDDMTKSSLFLRILMIIQLTHASFAAFYLKKNFLEKKIKLNKKILILYLRNISIVTTLIYFLSPIYFNYLNVNIKIDIIFILMSMYIYFWCLASYLEQFLTKFNFNRSILKYYLLSVIIYFFVLLITNSYNLISISLAMFISSFIYFICVVYKLNKLKLHNQ